MNRLRISPQAVARSLLSVFDSQQPLSKSEAERVHLALENCGVHDAESRLSAGFIRVALKAVTE